MIYINLIIIFLLIIFVHELGHYTIARFFKTSVTDFSIGFGKVLFQFDWNDAKLITRPLKPNILILW